MKIKDIPIDRAREVLSAGRSSEERRAEPVKLQVLVDPAAPRELVVAVRDALVPQTSRALVVVDPLGGCDPAIPADADVALVVAGGTDALTAPAVALATSRGVRCCVVAQSSVDAPEAPAGSEDAGLVAASSPDVLVEKLGTWLAESVEKDLALAANFPFVRKPMVDRLIGQCAAQNAAVGAVTIIPGADMPVMTANQAKLALDIAAVYGHDLTPERLAEVAGVVGGGFLWRSVARELVGLVPALGAILKAGVGYAGTMATGNAVRARFELGDSLLGGEAG